MSACDLPEGLPPLPPVPEGYSHWEYRGVGWKTNNKREYRICGAEHPHQDRWRRDPQHLKPQGRSYLHYIEAIAPAAETAQPTPGEGRANAAPIRKDGILVPSNYSFGAINQFVHDPEVSFEELQWAMLGMAASAEKELERRAADAEAQLDMTCDERWLFAKHALEKAVSQRTAAEAERDRLLSAIKDIAKQQIGDELGDGAKDADFEGGYELCVERAREALTAAGGEGITDKDRLDWLEANQQTVWRVVHTENRATTDARGGRTSVEVFDGWAVTREHEDDPASTIRAAIDAAMATEKGATP